MNALETFAPLTQPVVRRLEYGGGFLEDLKSEMFELCRR